MSGFSVFLIAVTIVLYLGQNFFTRLYSGDFQGDSQCASSVFTVFYGLITAAATFAYNGFSLHPDHLTLALGLINGIVLFLYNISFINASRLGPYSFQIILMYFGNLIIPIAFNVTLWQESLRPVTVAGVIFMLLALSIFNFGEGSMADAKKGYFFWVFILFATNGAYSALIDGQQRAEAGSLHQEMIIITFLTTAAAAAIYLIIKQKSRFLPSFRMGRKAALYMVLASISAAAAVNVLMITLRYVSSTILFPLNAGLLMVANAILGVLVLQEVLTKGRAAGIVLAVVSIVLLNL